MGNSMGGKRRAKVMKINGDTFKLKTPVRAGDVVKDYPGHVLMDSEAVKHFGIRAKPLEPQQELRPKKVYFLVELPKFPEGEEEGGRRLPRRVRSTGIQMSAKDRLECLMLSRRAASDLALARSEGGDGGRPRQVGEGPLTVKMRLTRAEMAKLVEESRDEKEVAERIMSLCYGDENVLPQGGRGGIKAKSSSSSSSSSSIKLSEKRVRFDPTEGGEIRTEIQPETS